MTGANIEKGKQMESAVEQPVITVTQPEKLGSLLETIALMNTVTERMSEDKSGDMGGGGQGGGGQGDDSSGPTWREQAIANLPPPQEMQKKIQNHVEKEMKTLQKDIHKATKHLTKQGAAYKLNELYARLRRLKGILRELLESSAEVIQRLYIRIFIDKQNAF